jgi:hypothetical protein
MKHPGCRDASSGPLTTGMLDPGRPRKRPPREPARLTALHRGFFPFTGPRVRGERSGRAGPRRPGRLPGLTPSGGGPCDGLRPGLGTTRSPACPRPPAERVAPPAGPACPPSDAPRATVTPGADAPARPEGAVFPATPPADGLVTRSTKGTAPPPHRPHHRTMPRRGRKVGEACGRLGMWGEVLATREGGGAERRWGSGGWVSDEDARAPELSPHGGAARRSRHRAVVTRTTTRHARACPGHPRIPLRPWWSSRGCPPQGRA